MNETNLKTEALELLGKLALTIKPRSNRRFTPSKRSPTLRRVKQLGVPDFGGQPASYSGKKYGQVFKETTGALS
ncbi:hypothetical protein [Microcoleus sp. herbarium14]|uniref:hypothetical protein n=1 Tax=Microcoleus sp. herbarium14 TaxID=3055439 RepID=UPI002FD4471D